MTNNTAPNWPAEHIAYLRANWSTKSGGKIAKELGYTRSAVLGKVNRLGLKKEPLLVKKQPQTRSKLPPISWTAPTEQTSGKQIHELSNKQCRWCTSETKPYEFCGEPVYRGSWCPEHYDRVYIRKQANG